MTELAVSEVERDRQALRLVITGDLDAAAAPECARMLRSAVGTAPTQGIVLVDLRTVHTLSAAGVHVVGAFAAENRQHERATYVLADGGSQAARVLQLTLAGDPPVCASPAEAIADYERGEQHGAGDDRLRAAAVFNEVPPPPVQAAMDRHVEHRSEAALAEGFAALTKVLLQAETVAGVFEHVTAAAMTLIPGAQLASLTLRDPDGRYSTPVQTEAVAGELDEVQYRTGRGPCVEAARPDGSGYALSGDLRSEQRWPEFTTYAIGNGLETVLSTELLPAASAGFTGALNVYARRPHGLTEIDQYAALLLATHASLALAHVRTIELAELAQTHLRRAIETRDVIGQAKGILMNRRGMTGEEAYELLRRISQDLNIKVNELAGTLTQRHHELDIPEP